MVKNTRKFMIRRTQSSSPITDGKGKVLKFETRYRATKYLEEHSSLPVSPYFIIYKQSKRFARVKKI